MATLRLTRAEYRERFGKLPPAQPKRRPPAANPAKPSANVEATAGSRLENIFADTWRQLGGPELKPEHKFDAKRKYRLDFAIPALRIGIEIDGGTWSKTRTAHNGGVGLSRDHKKQNLAVLQGWRIFRFTSDMLSGKTKVGHIAPVIEFVRGLQCKS